MADYVQKTNQTNCFKKEGFEGYSGAIKLDDGQEFWVTVYDNNGAKGAYRGVRLKVKQPSKDKPVADNSRNLSDDSEVPF